MLFYLLEVFVDEMQLGNLRHRKNGAAEEPRRY